MRIRVQGWAEWQSIASLSPSSRSRPPGCEFQLTPYQGVPNFLCYESSGSLLKPGDPFHNVLNV